MPYVNVAELKDASLIPDFYTMKDEDLFPEMLGIAKRFGMTLPELYYTEEFENDSPYWNDWETVTADRETLHDAMEALTPQGFTFGFVGTWSMGWHRDDESTKQYERLVGQEISSHTGRAVDVIPSLKKFMMEFLDMDETSIPEEYENMEGYGWQYVWKLIDAANNEIYCGLEISFNEGCGTCLEVQEPHEVWVEVPDKYFPNA